MSIIIYRIIVRLLQFIEMEKHKKTLMLTLQEQSNQVFNHYIYEENGIKPSSCFWKQLVYISKETPRILIPDTLVVNEKQQPLLWIYTNSQGRLQKNTNISLKDFVSKITNFCSPNQLTAAIKRLISKSGVNNYGNDIKLVNSRYLNNLSLQQLGDQVNCIQKYIKSHGNHSFVCRTAYSTKSHPYCFLITNIASYYDEDVPQNKRFMISNLNSNSLKSKFTIVKSTTGLHLKDTLPTLKQIVKYMRFQRGINIMEIVGDFIKDQESNWWLTNIKAFIIQQKIIKSIIPFSEINRQQGKKLTDKQRYQKTKQCKYCQKSYLQSQLTHKMTRKMLIQMDRYLLHLGKNYKWLLRSDANIDSHCMYQEFKICQRCYRLYIEIQQILHFQGVFLRKLGFQIEKDPKDLLMKLTNKEQLEMQSKNKQIHNLKVQIPQQISLGPNSSIIIKNDLPMRNDETIHEMVRYRFLFYLHQLDELVGIKHNHNYYFQFSIFHQKFKIKLDLHPKQKVSIIKKLRICYFFIQTKNEMKNLNEYINKNEFLRINLITENKNNQRNTIGKLNLDMKQFLGNGNIIKKNFYKFLDVQGVGYGWGLQGSIGLVRAEGQINTSRLILSTQDKLIYLTSHNYYLCQPLPQEWIDEIQNKHQKNKNAQGIKTNQMFIGVQETTQQFQKHQECFSQEQSKLSKINPRNLVLQQIKAYQTRGKVY